MPTPKIAADTYIMQGAVVRGDVVLESEVSVWYNAVVRGDTGSVRIGPRTNIQDNCVVHADEDVTVGSGVTVGHGAIVHGCTIGDNCIIGMGSMLLDGAQVGDNCVIGAGSLVTYNTKIPSGHLAFGSPAKVVRPLTEEEIAHNRQSAGNYILLAMVATEDGGA